MDSLRSFVHSRHRSLTSLAFYAADSRVRTLSFGSHIHISWFWFPHVHILHYTPRLPFSVSFSRVHATHDTDFHWVYLCLERLVHASLRVLVYAAPWLPVSRFTLPLVHRVPLSSVGFFIFCVSHATWFIFTRIFRVPRFLVGSHTNVPFLLHTFVRYATVHFGFSAV